VEARLKRKVDEGLKKRLGSDILRKVREGRVGRKRSVWRGGQRVLVEVVDLCGGEFGK